MLAPDSTTEPSVPEQVSPNLTRRVLIAEDAPETALFLSRILIKDGYTVDTVADGEQCLAMVDSVRPDLVLLDIMMPKVHGMDVLKAIHARSQAGTPVGVIVCSTRAFKADIDLAKSLGAFDFLTKPIHRQRLLDVVDAYFTARSSPGDADAAPVARNVQHQTYGDPLEERYIPTLKHLRTMIRLWGTRGSIPVPGQHVVRHGGNTSCLEVRCGDELIILDAGSGIRELGLELAKSPPRTIHLLIGHTHWDHIQGFPFFAPAYIPGFKIKIYGASGFGKDLASIFHGQLDSDYFPVDLRDLKAELEFLVLRDNPVHIGDIAVHWELMHHPGATVGFRLDFGPQERFARVAYVTDNEFLHGYLGHPRAVERRPELLLPYQRLLAFLLDVDLLISEAQYFNEDYPKKIGWGHSSLSNACLLAKLCRAKRWLITHHDPLDDDQILERKINLARQILREIEFNIEVNAAYDGFTEYLG